MVGILQKTGAGTLTFGGNQDDPNLSVEVVGGTINLGKTSTSGVHSVSSGSVAAALVIDSGALVKITGTGNDQIFDGSSVVVKAGVRWTWRRHGHRGVHRWAGWGRDGDQ